MGPTHADTHADPPNPPPAGAAAGVRRAIVAGFGPVGRVVTNTLEQAGFAITIVELNTQTLDRQRDLGRRAVLGDVTEPATLRAAGIAHAHALILAIPDQQQVLRACEAARKLSATIFISARTTHMSQGILASRAGADHVTVEEIVTADAMQQAVLSDLADRETAQPPTANAPAHNPATPTHFTCEAAHPR